MADADPRDDTSSTPLAETGRGDGAVPSVPRNEPLSAGDVFSIILTLVGMVVLWVGGTWLAHWLWELSWPVSVVVGPLSLMLVGGLAQMIYIFTTLDR